MPAPPPPIPRIAPQRPPTPGEREARVVRLRLSIAGTTEGEAHTTIYTGERRVLTAVPVDNAGQAIHGLTASWSSNRPEIVSVTPQGETWARQPGQANLTAQAGNKRAVFHVSVTPPPTPEPTPSVSPTPVSQQKPAEKQSESKAKNAAGNSGHRQAHAKSKKAALQYNDPETKWLYYPQNAVSPVPGKGTPGAQTPGVAATSTELPGSANFSFGVPVFGLPGRGPDAGAVAVYNSRLWHKSQYYNVRGQLVTKITYDVDKGWPAPGWRLGYGQVKYRYDINLGEWVAETLTDTLGGHHHLELTPPANGCANRYITNDGTFITYCDAGVNIGGTATFADGTQIFYEGSGPYQTRYPTKILDVNGNFLLISYVNGVGPRISSVQDTLGRHATFHYAANGDLVTVTVRGASARAFSNWTAFDGWHTQDAEYDFLGRAYRSSQPYYSNSSTSAINPAGLWSVQTFDNLSRTLTAAAPSGDADNPTTSTATFTYAGTVTTATDAAGRSRRQIIDALGRLIRVDEPDAAGSLGDVNTPNQPTYYWHNPLDNLTRIIQGAQSRYFRYDGLSRLTHERQPEQDTPYTFSDPLTLNNQWSRRYEYNAQSLVENAYDARQIRTNFAYDGLNRVQTVSYFNAQNQPQGTPAVTYAYGQARAGYFNNARLTTVTTAATGNTPETKHEYDYDKLGRTLRQKQYVGAANYTTSYAYNLGGLVTSETYPSGRVVGYEYDYGARLSKVTNGGATIYAQYFSYGAHGGLLSETWGNGGVHTLSYNRALQPLDIKLTVGGAEKQRFAYQYGQTDANTGATDTSKNTGQAGRMEGYTDGVLQWQQRFSYDSVGRLSQAREMRGDNLSQQTWQAQYTFDRYGNRFQSGAGNQGVGFTPVVTNDINAATNRFANTGATPTSYDAAGNVTSDQKFRYLQYAYDANGRMTWAARLDNTGQNTSVYDAGGQRVQTTAQGVTKTFVYDAAGDLIAEYRQGVLEREHIYRGGQLLVTDEQPPNCSVTLDQFITQFYQGALHRAPTQQELDQWKASLSPAQAQGFAPLFAQAQALGNALFAQPPYAFVNNTAFVTDLYGAYLQRTPDSGGLNWWVWLLDNEQATPEQVRTAFATSGEFEEKVAAICPSTTIGGLKYVLSDHQGSARLVANNTGLIVSRHDYAPFGEELWAGVGMRTTAQGFGATDTVRQRYGLTERDEATGLEHTWWRKYDNTAGRWTSPDPYNGSLNQDDPQSFNRYAYVSNDAPNMVDPEGLESWLPSAWERRNHAWFATHGFEIISNAWHLRPGNARIEFIPFRIRIGDSYETDYWVINWSFFQGHRKNLSVEKSSETPCHNTAQLEADFTQIGKSLNIAIDLTWMYNKGKDFAGITIEVTLTYKEINDKLKTTDITPGKRFEYTRLNIDRKHLGEDDWNIQMPSGLWYHLNVPRPVLGSKFGRGKNKAIGSFTIHCHGTNPIGIQHIKDTVKDTVKESLPGRLLRSIKRRISK